MYNIDRIQDREIVIFGTGLHSVKCIYYLQSEGIDISYCLENKHKEKEFCGYSVYEPEIDRIRNAFIIVATGGKAYMEISGQLQAHGLKEFADYVYYEWILKKIVLLHGNCHLSIIKSFLLSSEAFCCNYSIYPNSYICSNDKKKVEEETLKNCDVWVHEDIRPENIYGYNLSDEYMRKYVKADAIEIVIPHLFGLGGIFPQSELNDNKNKKINNGVGENGMFPHADKIIDKCVACGMGKDSIIRFCMGKTAIDADEIRSNFKLYMDKIRKRERNWDIKIAEFIIENYKNKKLFYDSWHPTNVILRKISIEILERLGINADDIHSRECLDSYEEPVYPIVREVLGLQWDDQLIRKGNAARRASDYMDFKEYIAEYLWWCYGMA